MERIITQKEVEPRMSFFGTKLPVPMEITEVLDSNLVTMVTTTGGNENGYISGYTASGSQKLSPSQQVIVKLIDGNSSSLDMVQVISEDEVGTTSGPLQSVSLLSRDGPISVHKLSGIPLGSNTSDTIPHQYSNSGISEVNSISADTNSGSQFTVWSCAYCRLVFPTANAIARHQEKDCSQNTNQNLQIPIERNKAKFSQLSSPLLQHSYAKLDAIKKSNIKSETKSSELSVDKNSNLESTAIPNADNLNEEIVNEDEFDLIWSCAICNEEFNNDNDLGEHLLSHSKQELSTALCKSIVPTKRKRVCADKRKNIDNGMKDELLNKTIELDSKIDQGNEDNNIEENVDYPDTVTLQNKHSYIKVENKRSYIKKKPGPKPQAKVTREKRRYVRKKLMKKLVPLSNLTGSRDPHTCHVCNKVLSSRGNLAKHLVQHKEDKPYVCQFCGQGFNAKRDQQHHILYKHTNDRPHKCDVCGKCFGDARVLAEHKIFHNEAREYSCDICGNMYRTAKCVTRHKKRHERDKNFTCEQCFKPFVVKADLKSHIHKVHKNQSTKSNMVSQQIMQSQQQTNLQVLNMQQNHMQQHSRSKETSALLLMGGGSSSELLDGTILNHQLNATQIHNYSHSHIKDIAISDSASIGETYTTLPSSSGTEIVSVAEPYIMINQGDEEGQLPGPDSSHSGLNIVQYTAQHQQGSIFFQEQHNPGVGKSNESGEEKWTIKETQKKINK